MVSTSARMLGLGIDEQRAEEAVGLFGEVASDFHVLLLVAADGDDVAVVEEDVGRHKHRVGEEAVGGRFASAAREVVFVGVAVFQHRHRRQAGEKPGQLGHQRHVTLAEEHGLRRVESAGEKVERHAQRVLTQGRRIVHGGEGVVVRDEIIRLAALLPLDRGAHHAEVVPEMRPAGGLDAGEDARSHGARINAETREGWRAFRRSPARALRAVSQDRA